MGAPYWIKRAIRKTLGRARITLMELQTLIVEIEAILNDRPITYVSSDISDEEPLTPSYLLYGRRITSLPFDYTITSEDLTDPDFGDGSDIRRRVKIQALILQRFWNRWKHDYLTSLREFHRTSGTNRQSIKKGEVMLVHDETPRTTWKLAVVEGLIKGGDGLVRAANIRTSNGCTNRPITKLYPLEVSTDVETQDGPLRETNNNAQVVTVDLHIRPRRAATSEALRRISEWARSLRAPPEDVEETLE